MIKKATIFNMADGQSVTLQMLQAHADRTPITEPKLGEIMTVGFEPMARRLPLVLHAGEFALVCAVLTEKVIPAACVARSVKKRCDAIETSEGRPVGRKERQNIKDEIVHSMLPNAPLKATRIPVVFELGSSKPAVFLSTTAGHIDAVQLVYRSALGLVFRNGPSMRLATVGGWAADGFAPESSGLELGDYVEFVREGSKAVLTGFDPSDDTPKDLAASGMRVKSLELICPKRVRARVDDALTLKSFKLEGCESETGAMDSGEALANDVALYAREAINFWLLLGASIGHA